MNEITLDEMIEEVRAKEAVTKEPENVTQMLKAVSMELIAAAETGKAEIFTDYDADGICSAYIMEKTLKAINPECDVAVHCNDRRGSYGLSEDVFPDDDESKCIVLDMGSNQLSLARENLGEDVIIIDHHLIEDEANRKAFMSLEPSTKNSCLCNPHSLNTDDSLNAQYCATGLAYRTYQESQNICKAFEKPFHTDEKLNNTLAVVACIGTATDMVNVLDTNSNNRQILKDGCKLIDNADEKNLDFVIGNVLARNGIGEIATAHQVAFNVGAFLNSASRMSELSNSNGSQEMYDAITGDPHASATFKKLDMLSERNTERKSYIGKLVCEDEYKEFVTEHRFGIYKNDNVGVYQLPDNTPTAMAGLIAGKLTETTDKAIICLTCNTEKGYYTGSGRNAASNKTSLMEFMKIALHDTDEKLDIQYGGHEDAIGISRLNDITTFIEQVEKNASEMKTKEKSEQTVLKLSPSEIGSQETLQKVLQLEPTGIGLQLPQIQIEGKETYRNAGFVKQRDDWKMVKVKAENTTLSISDWAYSPEAYPQTKKGEIAFKAELGLNDYQGLHVEASAKFDRAFITERKATLEKENTKTKTERV